MRLSKINTENLSDEQINQIVFEGISDNGDHSDIAIVFGNYDMLTQRTDKAIEMYKKRRVSKLLFTGGTHGITNTNKENISEARKMKELAILNQIPEEDILLEENSDNTFENIENSLQVIDKERGLGKIHSIMLISSDFHLKRCMLILKKYSDDKHVVLIPVKNGFSDQENWFVSKDLSWGSGRSIVSYEAKLLIKYAKEQNICDIEIDYV